MTTEISTVDGAPVFRPEAYQSEEAVALREYRAKPQSWLQRKARGILSLGGTIASSFSTVSGFALIFMGAIDEAPLAMGFGAILVSPALLTAAAAIGIEPSDARALKAAKNAADQSVEELNGWLQSTYGLKLSYASSALRRRAIGDGDAAMMLSLETVDGGSTLEARLVEVAPGAFQIRKKEISDPSDSGHFKPLSAAVSNALTAQRAPTAITAGRE